MYENFKLCKHLNPSEICIIVEQYTGGEMIRKFHEHVPRSRLNKDAHINLLRALCSHFSGDNPETIIRRHLNKIGKIPESQTIPIITVYSEPGVLRNYCGTNTSVWSDQVIEKEKFRNSN